jgi:hypothetical protein
MNFLRRLFGRHPLGLTVRQQLNETTAQAQWFRSQVLELSGRLEKVQKDLDAEIKRNRKREDELVAQILELGGGRRLAHRLEQPRLPNVDIETPDTTVTPIQESLLRERAREYCEQRSEGDEITGEMVERVYQQMLQDPQQWLSD